MPNRRVVVYTRAGCHLCEDARRLLLRHGLAPELVDIDRVPELRQRYTACVPVVVIDGKERFRGQINEMLLKRILAEPQPPAGGAG
jgi:glutaredoxin